MIVVLHTHPLGAAQPSDSSIMILLSVESCFLSSN